MSKFILQKINTKTGKVKERELPVDSWESAHEIETEKSAAWDAKYFGHVREV